MPTCYRKLIKAGCVGFVGLSLAHQVHSGDYDMGWKIAVAVTTFAVAMTNPAQAEAIGTGYYNGEEDIPAMKLMARWPIKSLMDEDWIKVDSLLHLGYGRWQHPDDSSQAGVNNVFELIPIFRFTYPKWPSIYIESAIGVSLFSRSEFGTQRFGTNFQFSDSLAFGGYLDRKNQWEVALQYQHYSNNSNTAINDGMDFIGINLFYNY